MRKSQVGLFAVRLQVIILLSLAGCNYSQTKGLNLDSSEAVLGAEQIDFEVVNSKIISPTCLMCHSEAGGNRGGLNLETYQNVIDNLDEIQARVLDRTMPPRRIGVLTDEQIKILTDWIAAGAVEKINQPVAPIEPVTPAPTEPPPVVVNPPPAADPPVPESTFAMVFKQVIEPSCLKCHSDAGGNSHRVNLETYANVFRLKADIRNAIVEGSMPRRSKLTDEQKKLILDWIDAGAHEKAQAIVGIQ